MRRSTAEDPWTPERLFVGAEDLDCTGRR